MVLDLRDYFNAVDVEIVHSTTGVVLEDTPFFGPPVCFCLRGSDSFTTTQFLAGRGIPCAGPRSITTKHSPDCALYPCPPLILSVPLLPRQCRRHSVILRALARLP